MYNILTLNAISPKGLDKLPGENFTVSGDIVNPDGIIVRSADMHEYNFPDSLLCVARAGAGTNNIPLDKCAEKGIVVFNTPGANANAVKELVIAALLLASSILCTTQMQPRLFGIPALGFLGYIMALGLAGYLVWEHFKNKNK